MIVRVNFFCSFEEGGRGVLRIVMEVSLVFGFFGSCAEVSMLFGSVGVKQHYLDATHSLRREIIFL